MASSGHGGQVVSGGSAEGPAGVPGARRGVKDNPRAFGQSGWYMNWDAGEEKQVRRAENPELSVDKSGWSGLCHRQMESHSSPGFGARAQYGGNEHAWRRHPEDFTSLGPPSQRRHKAQKTREEAFQRGNARLSNTAHRWVR